MRGQSTTEYLLVAAVLVLGLVAVIYHPGPHQIGMAFVKLFHGLVAQVARP